MKTANRPRRMPSGSILRFTPKRVSNPGSPRTSCRLTGGPLADFQLATRTGNVMPFAMAGGAYVNDVADRMTWRAAA